jgi:hypothetical protein
MDYFYTIEYHFFVEGKRFAIPFERGWNGRELTQTDLQDMLTEGRPRTVFYDEADRSKAKFINPGSDWMLYFWMAVLFTAIFAYFRWMLLKFYDLELS